MIECVNITAKIALPTGDRPQSWFKQTLQLTDFIGTNENAVKWQIWTGLLTHLLLHYLKFLSGWGKAFSRLVGIVRSAVWMDLDIVETLRLYGMVVILLKFFYLGPPGLLFAKWQSRVISQFRFVSQREKRHPPFLPQIRRHL